MGEPQQSATRDAIAAAIRDALGEHGFQFYNFGDLVDAADAVLPFVDAARAEGYEHGKREDQERARRGLARAVTAVKALPTAHYPGVGTVVELPDVLAVLEQQEAPNQKETI